MANAIKTAAEQNCDCYLCDGAGEVETVDRETNRVTVPCPECIAREIAEERAAALSATAKQPLLTVVVESYPESNGKRNWTALIRPVEKWDGLVGSCGGIVIDQGECWNRVAYEAERARFMLGLRDDEPFVLHYGDDIETPDQWKGEIGYEFPKPTNDTVKP